MTTPIRPSSSQPHIAGDGPPQVPRLLKQVSALAVASLLGCASQLAHSGDANGRFWLGGGTGGVACPQFVASMEKGRSLGVGSVGYVTETQGFTMYLLGFRTGYNMSTQDTCDIFPDGEKDYPLLSWAENYCRTNPSSRFADAVVAMARELHSKRQRVCAK